MEGIFYVINQLGVALSQANARISKLEEEKVALIAQISQSQQTSE